MVRLSKGTLSTLPKLSKNHDSHVWSRHPHLVLALTLILGLGIVEPALNPPTAEAACFFWQACARQRGQASNTRAGGKRTGRIRGGDDASIPYVITPRHTWIRQPGSAAPYMIRWNPVTGAERYTVRLWQWNHEQDQLNSALWETVVATHEIQLPNLMLAPGRYYAIEVVTDSGVSSRLDEGFYQSGFQILFEEDYEVLELQLAEVASSAPVEPSLALPILETEDTALAIAGVYFLEEMYADALTLLQTLAARPNPSNLVYTALGDTYSRAGLNQLSIEAYQQALRLANENSDLLSEATIRVNLADVYATLNQLESALDQLTLARRAYEQLQADIEVARLDLRIQLLSRLIPP